MDWPNLPKRCLIMLMVEASYTAERDRARGFESYSKNLIPNPIHKSYHILSTHT